MDGSSWGTVAVGIRDFLVLSGIGTMLLLAKSTFTAIRNQESGERNESNDSGT